MTLTYRWAGVTDTGKTRTENQDSVYPEGLGEGTNGSWQPQMALAVIRAVTLRAGALSMRSRRHLRGSVVRNSSEPPTIGSSPIVEHTITSEALFDPGHEHCCHLGVG